MDRRKKLLNSPEARTLTMLHSAAERNRCRVFPKVRVADVLNIDGSGIPNALYTYALSSHFDFVAVDADSCPLFAVEFDGPHHAEAPRARVNDLKKNALSEKFGFPLARVRDEHIFEKARGLDYLTWLVELYFAQQDIYNAYLDGTIPPSEYVDPFMFISHPAVPGAFPLWISMDERVRLRAFCEAGISAAPVPMSFAGDGDNGSTVLMVLPVRGGRFLVEYASIYVYGFGTTASEVADEIAVVNMAHRLQRYADGEPEAVSSGEARRKLVRFFQSHRCLSFEGMHTNMGFDLAYHGGPEPAHWRVGALGEEPEVTIMANRSA